MKTAPVKYPRTYHLPWSAGVTSDDKVHKDVAAMFDGREVVVTEKMDGENTTLYRDHLHARSMDGRSHPSRSWVKMMWAAIAADIPEGWRVCGENLYAQHSLSYDSLQSYFYGFSVWDQNNNCLSWDDTVEWLQLLRIVPVLVLWRGVFDAKRLERLAGQLDTSKTEGYVVRLADSFHYNEFKQSVAKYVRKGHVAAGSSHWMHSEIRPNSLKQDSGTGN